MLDIQTYLTSIYHFYKWFLVEVLEYQEREIGSFNFKKQFSDIVNFIRNIQVDRSMELVDDNSSMSVQDLNQAMEMVQLQRNAIDITTEVQKFLMLEHGVSRANDPTSGINNMQLRDSHHENVFRGSQEIRYSNVSFNMEPYRGEQSTALKASPGVQ